MLPIRHALGLKQSEVSRAVSALGGRLAVSMVSALESGSRGTSLDNVRKLAAALSCATDDLMFEPAETRLETIRADYLERQAAQARAQADAAKAAEEVA